MSWRVRPEEILLEVGRLFGSKVGLQQLNVEVSETSCKYNGWSANEMDTAFAEFLVATIRCKFGPCIDRQLFVAAANASFHHDWHLQRRTRRD